jgi:hypothetical protein
MKDKWGTWWDSLTPQTQAYLKSQPIWHDVDLYKTFAFGLLLGFLIGLLF